MSLPSCFLSCNFQATNVFLSHADPGGLISHVRARIRAATQNFSLVNSRTAINLGKLKSGLARHMA